MTQEEREQKVAEYIAKIHGLSDFGGSLSDLMNKIKPLLFPLSCSPNNAHPLGIFPGPSVNNQLF